MGAATGFGGAWRTLLPRTNPAQARNRARAPSPAPLAGEGGLGGGGPWVGAPGRATPPGHGLGQPGACISRALPAWLCRVDTAQRCHGPDTLRPCERPVPRARVCSSAELVGSWPQHKGVPWSGWHLFPLKRGFGGTGCC